MFAQSKSGKQMGEDDYNSMSQILPQCDDHGNDVLLLVQSISSVESRYPPSYYVEFLKTLSSSAPVCATIHPSIELRNLLHQLADGLEVKEDILALTKLQREIPALYTLIIGQPEASIPEAVRPLLRALQYWSEYPFRSCDGVPGSDSIVERELAYFPRNPMVRGRGNYSKDSATKRERCKKMYTGHQSLLPGIFTVLCEHGVCLGYEVMKNHESPNVPFSIFLTRFKTAPKVIVYDNACGLHVYCLNREPKYFETTWFLVDRFHWRNHTACPIGYKLDSYPQFRKLNSQINEQINSGLKKIKSFLAYMSQDNFMLHCSLYLYMHNKRVIEKL